MKAKPRKTNKKNVNALVALFLLISILIASVALAESITPEEKVKAVFKQVESSLSSLKGANALTKSNVREVLTQYFLPEVNALYFSNKVLNKNLPKISDDLKAEFVTELTSQLLNTYSNLLLKRDDESIIVESGSISKSGKIAMVNLSIVGKNKTNKAVVKLLQSANDSWQFFDLVVEGVSVIDTRQKEMNSSFNKLGINGTLEHLKSINQRSITSS